MRLQIIQDDQGKNAGVFIAMEDWVMIKHQYPDIEDVDLNLPEWEKELIEQRLAAIAKSPERIKPGKKLLEALKPKI